MYSLIEIEELLYKQLRVGAPCIKIAMLISCAFEGRDFPPDELINEALEHLARRKDVETFGIIQKWRRSEIKRVYAYKEK